MKRPTHRQAGCKQLRELFNVEAVKKKVEVIR